MAYLRTLLPKVLIALAMGVGSMHASENAEAPPEDVASGTEAPLVDPSELGPARVPPAEITPEASRMPKPGDPNELTPGESMAWRDLREVVARERDIWARLQEHPDDEMEQQRANAEFRHVMTAYENVIRSAPKFADAYAAYGLLLSRTGNREEAVRVFLQANRLDPNLPMVKNQIGNYLFEDGRYKDALGYYLAAIQLKPDEALYHYQLGSLLHAYRQFFIQDGLYSAARLDGLMQEAFREAARLAPDRWPYIYRYAESFYDLETPDWPAALEVWNSLETRAKPGVEKQAIHLHQAHVLAKMGRTEEARRVVDSVVEPSLLETKAEVMAVIDPPPQTSQPASAPAAPATVEPEPAPVTVPEAAAEGQESTPAIASPAAPGAGEAMP